MQEKHDNSHLRLAYSEILRCYSPLYYNNKQIYIKHLNQLDSSIIDIKRQEYIEYFQSRGSLSYKDKLAEIIEKGFWSEAKDKEIGEIQSFISNLHLSKSKCTIKKDKDMYDREIEKYNDRLFGMVIEKDKLIGKTADSRAGKKINEFYLFISLYSDENLEKKLFMEEEFDTLDEGELIKLGKLYHDKMNMLNSDNLKRIALMPYFFNIYVLAGDNLFNLFGKPLIYLTTYQIELIQNAKNYKNILQNAKNPPPPECLSDPNKLMEWFNKSETLDKIMEGTQMEEASDKKVLSAAKSVVGASKEELKEMGIDTAAQDKITEALKKKGSELTMLELMRLEGHDIR